MARKEVLVFTILLFCTSSLSQARNIKAEDEKLIVKDDVQEAVVACNPHPSDLSDHYIIGYGSLMESASKDRTYQNTGENIPVQVSGFRREWNLKGDSIGPDTTYLGVVPDAAASFNGVVFQLPQSENVTESLTSYDKREKYYCRRQVEQSKIKILANIENDGKKTMSKQKQYWIYVNKPQFTAGPTKKYPIVQSYVDIFISGCLEMEEKHSLTDFAKKCVETTKGWNVDYWKNDRIFPRRPFVHQKKAVKIDKVLLETISKEFENISIEG